MTEATFTFLRPVWLWCLVPLLLAAVAWFRRPRSQGAWERVVDPALAPYVVEPASEGRRRDASWLFVGWVLAIVILAGPVREQQPVPVYEARRAQVIVFDLSGSMLATDLAPDRLTRARYKLGDLIERAAGTRTGLIAFAERPYVISPLTDDAATLTAFVPSLSPAIVPVRGSRPDLALARAVELLEQAGGDAGHIILMSDAAMIERDIEAAGVAAAAGHRVSVLGVGTKAGVPLRDENGQFVRRSNGDIVVPQLDLASQSALADAGRGVAIALSSDTRDLAALERIDSAIRRSGDAEDKEPRELYWIERAPWLLPVLAVLALGLFRRGVIT